MLNAAGDVSLLCLTTVVGSYHGNKLDMALLVFIILLNHTLSKTLLTICLVPWGRRLCCGERYSCARLGSVYAYATDKRGRSSVEHVDQLHLEKYITSKTCVAWFCLSSLSKPRVFSLPLLLLSLTLELSVPEAGLTAEPSGRARSLVSD